MISNKSLLSSYIELRKSKEIIKLLEDKINYVFLFFVNNIIIIIFNIMNH